MEITERELTIISILITLMIALVPAFFKWVVSINRTRKETKKWREEQISYRLVPYLDTDRKRLEVVESPCFIPLCGQYIAPSNLDDFKASKEKFLLVKKFLDEILISNNKTGKKRYLILGGSGTGKSIFAVSLFEQYIKKYTQKSIPFPIYAYYLGQRDIIEQIRILANGPDACKAILILDALDENLNAIKNTESFLEQLNIVTDKFKFVIITSRTQLFYNEDEELGESKVLQPQLDNIKFEKIYLSPFDDDEIISYLSNKFPVGTSEYSKAKQIVDKAGTVMSRPMLLSFIEDLLGMRHVSVVSTVEIYKRIIDEWLKRECRTEHAQVCRINVEQLYLFSKKLAVYMYDKWIEKDGISISVDEYNDFINICGYSSSPYSFRDRSLINRRSDGSIKFSHKSFWEFFIALDVLEHPGKSYNSNNMDMSKRFVAEFNELYLKGVKFEGVDYYERNYSKFTKNNILALIKLLPQNIDDMEYSIQKEDFILWTYDFWSELEHQVVNLYLMVDDSLRVVETEWVQMVGGVLMRLRVNMLVAGLIQSFYTNFSDYRKQVMLFKDTLFDIKKLLEQNNDFDSYFPIKQYEIVAFPNLYVLNDEIVRNVLSHNVICIGTGFYKDMPIYTLVGKLLKTNTDSPIIHIIKEYCSIDCAVSFIYGLSDHIKQTVPKFKSVIVVEVHVSNIEATYVVNSQTYRSSVDSIRDYLSYMFEKKMSH